MLIWLLTTVLLHPVHETVSEVEWNAETNRLEVALRLHILDEQWLKRRYAGQASGYAEWAPAYLKKKYRVDPPKKPGRATRAAYHWVGRKQEGSHVWWFFEIEPPGDAAPETIEQRMLYERDERYAHRMVILGEDVPKALKLNVRQPVGKLGL